MPRNATVRHSATEKLSESELSKFELSESELESCLRILEAAIDSVPVATHAGLTISETIRLADPLVSEGLLLALDDEPWAPTIEGFKLIQGRRADRRDQHARIFAVRTVSHSPISHCAACSRASVAAGQV